MRVNSRILKTGLVLIVVTMMLAECTGRGILGRLNASQTEVVTIDMKATPLQTEMPVPNNVTQAAQSGSATSNANPPTTSPKTATSTDESDAELEVLMDELGTALDELEASTTKADQDSLLDSTLAALGK